jgi:NAD+ diphosphatase
MLGFLAQADPAQPLHTDPGEIADARWFARPQVASAARRTPDCEFWISNPSSIAYSLIMMWLAEEVP